MKQILIADDNSAMLRLYEFHISKKGWTGHYFESGKEAMQWLSGNYPDVAILDYDLKDSVGTEIYEVIRSIHRKQEIPVIFITSQIHKEIRSKLASLENSQVMTKPFSPAALVREIEKLLHE